MNKPFLLLAFLFSFSISGYTQPQQKIEWDAQNKEVEKMIIKGLQPYFKQYVSSEIKMTDCAVDSVKISARNRTLWIFANTRFGYQPFRHQVVNQIYHDIRPYLPLAYSKFNLTILVDRQPIQNLIPNYYTDQPIREKLFSSNLSDKSPAWVTNLSRPYKIKDGLDGHHVALWQSHGKYYSYKLKKWEWQRPNLFTTSEDLLSQSFVLPYLIPMLENAGAVVFTPRERDTQTNEVIVDNDGCTIGQDIGSQIHEHNSKNAFWRKSDSPGFAHQKAEYTGTENPFKTGTARQINAEKRNRTENAYTEWIPNVPVSGEYAVYVSYQSLPNSISDAHYEVYHSGGRTRFSVNQRMGGGTWVYLGTFVFDKGVNDYCKVVLSNGSDEHGVVTADAVRFGGGKGNISRGGSISNLPRYLEAARYYAQWAGMPDSIYNRYEGKDDYSDDIHARPRMVNYLAGGSAFNPSEPGQKVPFELDLAVHTDAGVNEGDTIIGSLGVYTTDFNEGLLASGVNRFTSRDLVDLLLSQLKSDIRNTYGIDWTRRDMWNRNYGETRIPAIPSAIIETLSHQSFSDMKMALDPNFQFTLGRALYKGILRYLSTQHQTDYIVQPLPVTQFAILFGKEKNTVKLTWAPQSDPIEPTAAPTDYVVYTRMGDGGFDNGILVNEPEYTVRLEPDRIYSFRIAAVNRGGESFPSEILCAYIDPFEAGRVLIVNGFDRICGPAVIDRNGEAGFDIFADPGVAYKQNISLAGEQLNFDRARIRKGWGDSESDLAGTGYAGNTFDYVFLHALAIKESGQYSFVSTSDEAFSTRQVSPNEYKAIDYLLGLETRNSQTYSAPGQNYQTFDPNVQQVLTKYLSEGGNLFASGAYIGSDMTQSERDKSFTKNLLKYSFNSKFAPGTDIFYVNGLNQRFYIQSWLNSSCYPVVSSDVITPEDAAFSPFAYADGGYSAAVAYPGSTYQTFILGFPFESITDSHTRNIIMASVLKFFSEK